MSGLVLSCQREEWAVMIDDWEAWNPSLPCKCFFHKKTGATHRAYLQGHFSYHYTQCPRLPTSRAIHSQPCSFPSLHPSSSCYPQKNAQMLEYSTPMKSKRGMERRPFPLVCLRATFVLQAMDWSFLELKSDDKIINGTRAMSYLISCIFMKGATQLGPYSMERENKECSTPNSGHEKCHCGDEEPDWESWSDYSVYFEKKGVEFAETTTTPREASSTLQTRG